MTTAVCAAGFLGLKDLGVGKEKIEDETHQEQEADMISLSGYADSPDYQFMRSMKGTFHPVMLNVGDMDQYREWTCWTSTGEELLLANSSTKALIIAERERSFVVVNVLGNIMSGSFDVSDEMLQNLAETFDFSAIP